MASKAAKKSAAGHVRGASTSRRQGRGDKELQSVNEELKTVNTQLKSKITELEVTNSDLRNLLASNEVATLCLDRTFRIKWFTPAAHRLFNLLPSDIGRPITDLALTTIDSTLIEDAASVQRTEEPRSHELEHKGIYLRRIVPYRTDNRRIGGVVITFADISEAKRAAQAEVRERQSIARDLHDGLGQELNAASIKLEALRSAGGSRALDEIAVLLEGVVREMRSLTAQLNPPVLEQLGLDESPAGGAEAGTDSLGKREKQVLKLIAEGQRSAAIAERMNITVATVEAHRRNILRKLRLHSAADLTRYAIRQGLISP